MLGQGEWGIVLGVWVLAGLLHVSYLAHWVFPLGNHIKSYTLLDGEPIDPQKATILVCLHNEIVNLPRLQRALDAQKPTGCRLLLVDDRSTDGTQEALQHWTAHNPQVQVLRVDTTPDGWAPKKWAIRAGLGQTGTPYVLLTDADCVMAPDWAATLTRTLELQTGTAAVLGFGAYTAASAPPLHALVQYDTAYTWIQYAGEAANGRPYMGVGRNIAINMGYLDVESLYSNCHSVLSGDDDFLIQHLAQSGKVALLPPQVTPTFSAPPASLSSWFQQKTRHASAGSAYPSRVLRRLALFHGTHLVATLGALLLSCWYGPIAWVALGTYLARHVLLASLAQYLLQGVSEARKLIIFPLTEFLYWGYLLVAVPRSWLGNMAWQTREHPQHRAKTPT